MLGWSEQCDIKLTGRWLWVGPAARLTRQDLGLKLEKLSIWVPVRLNGEKVAGEVPVKAGDFIQVGKRKLKVLEGDSPF